MISADGGELLIIMLVNAFLFLLCILLMKGTMHMMSMLLIYLFRYIVIIELVNVCI